MTTKRMSRQEQGQAVRNVIRYAQTSGEPVVLGFEHGVYAYNGYPYWRVKYNGRTVGQASGAGYDVKGTALAEAFNQAIPDVIRHYADTHDALPYGMTKGGHLDGGCGIECVRDCIEHLFDCTATLTDEAFVFIPSAEPKVSAEVWKDE